VNSQMRSQCAVPITVEPLQLSAGSLLRPSRPDQASAFGGALAFDLEGEHTSRDTFPRWSARRTLAFILISNSLLWWGILHAVHVFR